MLFELLFVALMVTAVVTLAYAAILAARKQRQRAVSLLLKLGVAVALYLTVLIVVSLASPQRVLSMGDDWCFDDWCVAAEEVEVATELGPNGDRTKANGLFYIVKLRLSNHARGRAQQASSTAVHLLDSRGHWYDVSTRGQFAFEAQHGAAPPLTTEIAVGQSLSTFQIFDLPSDAHGVGLNVEHPVGVSPGYFIIGDQASLLHRPTVIKLK